MGEILNNCLYTTALFSVYVYFDSKNFYKIIKKKKNSLRKSAISRDAFICMGAPNPICRTFLLLVRVEGETPEVGVTDDLFKYCVKGEEGETLAPRAVQGVAGPVQPAGLTHTAVVLHTGRLRTQGLQPIHIMHWLVATHCKWKVSTDLEV